LNSLALDGKKDGWICSLFSFFGLSMDGLMDRWTDSIYCGCIYR